MAHIMIVETHLLRGARLELEYALVDKSSLHPLALVDEVMTLHSGERNRRLQRSDATWRNPGPAHSLRVGARSRLDELASAKTLLSAELEILGALAGQVGGRLVATGMHPWMRAAEGKIWPHGDHRRDQALAWLFGAARHGFCNQQCLGLSLPFENEIQFERLFAALRFAMPLMPALAASSPFVEGIRGPALSCRLAARRDYFASNPALACSLVPDALPNREAYQNEVLRPLERVLRASPETASLQPLDVCGHGLLADFDDGLIHIRMLDMQECLQADLSVCAVVAGIAQLILREGAMPHHTLRDWPSARLAELVESTLVAGTQAVVRDAEFLRAFDFPEGGTCRVSELVQYLLEDALADDAEVASHMPTLRHIASRGSLAERCVRKLGERSTDEDLFNLYRQLADCLPSDELL